MVCLRVSNRSYRRLQGHCKGVNKLSGYRLWFGQMSVDSCSKNRCCSCGRASFYKAVIVLSALPIAEPSDFCSKSAAAADVCDFSRITTRSSHQNRVDCRAVCKPGARRSNRLVTSCSSFREQNINLPGTTLAERTRIQSFFFKGIARLADTELLMISAFPRPF